MYRLTTLIAGLLLMTSCSGDSDGGDGDQSAADAGSPTESTSAPAASPTESAAGDPCSLLTAKDARKILGGPVQDPEPGDLAGLPQCVWPAKTGTSRVQVASIDASTWSRSLPDILQQLEASIPASDKSNLDKLRKGADLVESGQDLDSDEACSLFSDMLEVQGQPPGSKSIVSVFPSLDKAQAVSAQICTNGHYTTVTTTDPDGLDDPLPTEAVGRAARRVHRAATA